MDVLEKVFNGLELNEGSGDDVTDVETGNLGVTQMARDSFPEAAHLPDEYIAKLYIAKLNAELGTLEGYSEAPDGVREALLDTAYNVGPSILKWSGMAQGLKDKDYESTLKNLLDTANVDGKSMKGLAGRRARSYNLGSNDPITKVIQGMDGSLMYRNGAGDEVFSYAKERHPKSSAGILDIGGAL